MNTDEVGRIAEAKILAKLTELGYQVSIPWGNGARYDLILEQAGALYKVQIKSAVYKKGSVVFKSRSINYWTKKQKDYIGQIDYFGIYCAALDSCYLVPMEENFPISEVWLRVDPTNSVSSKRRWAKDYIL